MYVFLVWTEDNLLLLFQEQTAIDPHPVNPADMAASASGSVYLGVDDEV